MSRRIKLVNQNIRISPSDKKKAHDLGLNVSMIARNAIKARIKYLTLKARREAEPEPRALTPDQVTLAGSPAIEMHIQIPPAPEPVKAATLSEIMEMAKEETGDPEGSPVLEVNTLTGAPKAEKHTELTSETGKNDQDPDREVLHNGIV